MSNFQQQCDRFTQAVLIHRSHQPDPKPQLYLCRVRERVRDKTSAFIFISHDCTIQRMVICGGNAGFCNPDTFRGDAKGCIFPFRCEVFESITLIDLGAIEIFS